jgi:hypothetical protein
MKFGIPLLALAFFVPCTWAAVIDGTTSGRAENVTIVDLKDADGIVILTFSEPLKGGPACASQHRDALVIVNSSSLDGDHARRAFQLGQALKVAGGGNCKRVSGYESLSSLEMMQ